MNGTGVRFEVLNKDIYETWKIHIRAVLIKNDMWGYVSGTIVKPEVVAMNPSEVKQIKGCETSREIWTKLEGI